MELCIYDAGCFKPGEDLVLALGATAAAAALACAGAVLALDALDDFGKGVPGQRGFVIHVRDAVIFVKIKVAQACRLVGLEPCLVSPAHRLSVSVHNAGRTDSLKYEEIRVALRKVAERLEIH